MDKLIESLKTYIPHDEDERKARSFMQAFIAQNPDCLTRENETAHFTASAWIVNKNRDKALMVFHNIYNAWSWTGGHADGCDDMLAVALKEAREETGISDFSVLSDNIFSVEILNVGGHVKKGKTVKAHRHLNVTYLLEADDTLPLKVREEENSAVAWLSLQNAENTPEEQMRPIYEKLNRKLREL